MATSEPGGPSVELAGVLLVVSVLLVLAFILLTVSLMRLRGTTRELEATLADESGARDRAALLLDSLRRQLVACPRRGAQRRPDPRRPDHGRGRRRDVPG